MQLSGQKFRPLFFEARAHGALIILLGLLVYSNTFTATFHFDDHLYITNNEQLRDLSNYRSPTATRWFGSLTFALNYHIHGLEVAGYHAVNISIHLLAALLVYILVVLTFRTPLFLEAGAPGPVPRLTALVAALLFVAHPLQTQAVTYISQRYTSLATLLYLLALLAYVEARLTVAGRNRYLLSALSLLATVLAMKTKEISFTIPFSIMLYEMFFLRRAGKAGAGGEERLLDRRLLLRLLPYAATLVIIPLSLLGPELGLLGPADGVDEKLRSMKLSEAAHLSRHVYLVTQFRVIVTYIRLLLLPVDQNLDYDYPVYREFFAPGVLGSLLVLCALAAAAVYLYRRGSGDPVLRITAFGVFWFFLTLSVESSIIPIQDIIFEHRLYLPSIGVCLAFAASVVPLAGRLERGRTRNAVIAFVAALVFGLSGAAYVRNAVWRDDVSLWTDVVSKSPAKPQPHLNLGTAYAEQGALDKAIESYKRALALDASYAEAYNGLGLAYMYKGMAAAAAEQYASAIRLRPDYAAAHYNFGLLYLNQGGRYYDRAREELELALRIAPFGNDAAMLIRYLDRVSSGAPSRP